MPQIDDDGFRDKIGDLRAEADIPVQVMDEDFDRTSILQLKQSYSICHCTKLIIRQGKREEALMSFLMSYLSVNVNVLCSGGSDCRIGQY
jgi:hypothetical protein